MRVLRLITGLTFTRFGTNPKENCPLNTRINAKNFAAIKHRTFRIFRVFRGHQVVRESGEARTMSDRTTINKAEIRTLIPHSGLMCLLDEVAQWADQSIVCITNTHRDPVNPLRREGRLSALHAFEYGAQAAAVHGGLRARSAGTTAAP